MNGIEVRFIAVFPGAATDAILRANLSAAELALIATRGVPADRDRMITARAAARQTLGVLLGLPPEHLPLGACRRTGKPFVRASPPSRS